MTLGLSAERTTCAPASGAAAVSVTVPVTGRPPMTLGESRVTEARVGSVVIAGSSSEGVGLDRCLRPRRLGSLELGGEGQDPVVEAHLLRGPRQRVPRHVDGHRCAAYGNDDALRQLAERPARRRRRRAARAGARDGGPAQTTRRASHPPSLQRQGAAARHPRPGSSPVRCAGMLRCRHGIHGSWARGRSPSAAGLCAL